MGAVRGADQSGRRHPLGPPSRCGVPPHHRQGESGAGGGVRRLHLHSGLVLPGGRGCRKQQGEPWARRVRDFLVIVADSHCQPLPGS